MCEPLFSGSGVVTLTRHVRSLFSPCPDSVLRHAPLPPPRPLPRAVVNSRPPTCRRRPAGSGVLPGLHRSGDNHWAKKSHFMGISNWDCVRFEGFPEVVFILNPPELKFGCVWFLALLSYSFLSPLKTRKRKSTSPLDGLRGLYPPPPHGDPAPFVHHSPSGVHAFTRQEARSGASAGPRGETMKADPLPFFWLISGSLPGASIRPTATFICHPALQEKHIPWQIPAPCVPE